MSLMVNFQLLGQVDVKPNYKSFQDKYKLKTSLGFQLWSTYTMNEKRFDEASNSYVNVDDRWNNQLRRSRLSVSGQPYPGLSFKLTASLDLVGRDAFAATQGGNNNTSVGQFGLWNMYVRWKPFANSDLLHITGGFQPPQIGRESITGALNSTSFEKSWSQNYLRRSIVGVGSGRAMGVNIGGQKKVNQYFSFSYDLGGFNPQAFSNVNNSAGIQSSPLFVGRLALYFGQPESERYSTGHKINYFGKRNGLTLALAGSRQGRTDVFDRNEALGFDWLLNYGMLNVDGEWTFFSRNKWIEENNYASHSSGGYLRIGYNIELSNQHFLEPVLMIVKFNGPLSSTAQNDASIINAFAGNDEVIDIGLNYHLNPKLKISITYTINQGELGESLPGATFNNYYRNSNKQAIERGNLLGFALVGIF
ncbi:hypothetical protein GCM10007940_22880 [Portibacter lacus]|uniref:Porin n=2 Tax=Portibacter lacus TaxID=1099794 RepID=A0AA37ST39_9BACT|nr:hypothetical protein GCM10007940_22880 [Portibacter lacus]